MNVTKWINQIFVVAVVSVCVQTTFASPSIPYTQDEYEIRDHMEEMYNLKDQIFSKLAEEELTLTADNISQLRVHLHSVMPKEPNKIKGLEDEVLKRKQMIQYQKYIAKVILITLELEEVVLQIPLDNVQRSIKDDKINALVTNMLKIISLGHTQFR